MKYRVQFEKVGAARFSSHKDVVRIFQRCFASSRIPVSYSQGFRPHMKMSFGPPLKTGWEGLEEYMDVYTEGPVGAKTRTCNEFLPEGLRIAGFGELDDRAPKIANDISAVQMSICMRDVDLPGPELRDGGQAGFDAERSIQDIAGLPGSSGPADDTNGKTPEIIDVNVYGGDEITCIDYTSTMLSGRIVRPDQVLAAAIGETAVSRFPVRITRRALYISRGGEYLSPMSQGVIKNRL